MRQEVIRKLLGAVAVCLITVACASGAGEQSLDSYFVSLAGISAEFGESAAVLPEAGPSSPGGVEDTQTFFRGIQEALVRAEADVEALNPPAEVEEAHTLLVEALKEWVALGSKIGEEVDELETAEELVELSNHSEFGVDNYNAAVEGVVQACVQLQIGADQNDVEVDLGCARFRG